MIDPMMSTRGLADEQRESLRLLDALLAHEPERARTRFREHIGDSKKRSMVGLVEREDGTGFKAK